MRQFKSSLKSSRDRVAGFANALKHAQARVRLYLGGIEYVGEKQCLVGFFIEGIKDGVIGPSPIVHQSERVIALPSFFWEITEFVLTAANLLEIAVSSIISTEPAERDRERSPLPKNLIEKVVRIPHYSFDGVNAVERCKFRFRGEAFTQVINGAKLMGAIGREWPVSSDIRFTNSLLTYAGDGVSRQFALVDPGQLRMHRWSRG